MKSIKQVKMVLALCVSVSGFARAGVVEKPVVMPDAMVSATVSDLHGFIDGVGSVAAQVSPMMNGMMLKGMIGQQLGDPGLAGIAPGKGLAIVAMDPTNMFGVIEVSAAQLGAYTNALSAQGIQTEYVNGVLVAAKSADMVAKGKKLAGQVESTLLAKRSPTLRIGVRPADLIAKNDAQIQGMLQMMPMMMGMQMQQAPGMTPEKAKTAIRMLEGEIRVLLSLTKQCDAAEVTIAPKNGSLRIDETFDPKAGTRLAALLNAPASTKADPKVQAGIFDKGMIALDGTMANPDAIGAFAEAEGSELLKDMNVTNVNASALFAPMNKRLKMYSGPFCEDVDIENGSGLSFGCVISIKDESGTLDLLRNIKKDMEPLLKLYESMGMPLSFDFKENQREYKGIKIHQLKMAMSLSNLPDMQQKQMAAMGLTNLVCDVAVFDGMRLCAMGSGKIEQAIDRLKDKNFKPSPLKAHSDYPAGGFYYCDVDVGKYMSLIASAMPEIPNDPMPQIVAMLKGADPVTSAGFHENGNIMWSVNVPGSLIGKYGQVIMMMQMQKMQQGGGMQAMPGQMPSGAPTGAPTAAPVQ